MSLSEFLLLAAAFIGLAIYRSIQNHQREVLKTIREEREKLSIYLEWLGKLTKTDVDEDTQILIGMHRDARLRCVGKDFDEADEIMERSREEMKEFRKFQTGEIWTKKEEQPPQSDEG